MAKNTSADPAPAKKGKLKLILIVSFLILLALGLAIGGTYWFLEGNLPGIKNNEVAEDQAEEPDFKVSVYLDLEKPIRTNVQAEGRQRLAQVYISLEAESQEVLDSAKIHSPLLISELGQLLGARSFDGLRAAEDRRELAQAMTEKINELLANENAAPIRQVLFRNFVVQ